LQTSEREGESTGATALNNKCNENKNKSSVEEEKGGESPKRTTWRRKRRGRIKYMTQG